MKKQRHFALLAALLAACTLTLCSCEGNDSNYREPEAYFDDMAEEEIAFESESEGFYNQKANGGEAADAVEGQARKIIYSCSYTIQTNDFDESVRRLEVLIEKYGGYNENAEVYGSGSSSRHANYTVRVPAEKYEAFREETGDIGSVVRATESGRDVSETYFDTEARLESAKLHEERLLAILEKSESLEDVIQLENSLAEVRYEIESLTGTLKKYDALIDYATVEVTIDEVLKVTVVEETPKTFGERVWQACKGSVSAFRDGMENFLIFLIYALPVLLILGVIALVVVLIVKGSIRHNRKKREKKEAEAKGKE